MSEHVEISAIVPVVRLVDESGTLIKDYIEVLEKIEENFELVYVLDGEHANILEQLKAIAANERRLRIVQLAKNFGEATALTAGFALAKGNIILTLPAYPQVDLLEIPKLISELEQSDVAVATRIPVSKSTNSKFHRARRRIFHWLVKAATGQEFNDLGCGVRAMKRDVISELPLYGDQYRFFALLATQRGFRVSEVTVKEAREIRVIDRHGVRDYVARMIDIFAIVFLTRFTKRPLRFFGAIGSVIFAFGAVVMLVVVVQKLVFQVGLADRPALLLASLMVVLGLQIFALGLLGELIIFTHAKDIKEYTIEKIVN
jgi:glycosyltransferase involved in cell wall biosynthesis